MKITVLLCCKIEYHDIQIEIIRILTFYKVYIIFDEIRTFDIIDMINFVDKICYYNQILF